MEPARSRRPDAVLVREALAGQPAAFDVLMERYRGVVYQLSWRTLGDEHLAWDAVQESFIAAYRGLKSLQRRDRFAPWLKQIARRSCARLHRKAGPVEPVDPAALAALPAEGDRGGGHTAELVRRALAGLSPTGRRAAELHYFDGLSCEEVGTFLGLSEGAVKTRLHRSRETLRRELRRMGAPGAEKLVIRYVSHWGSGAEGLFYEQHSKELYAELYPQGDLSSQPWGETGLARQEALAQIARWEALCVVRRRGNSVVCLMPVITDDDEAIMRPWREEAVERAEPALRRLVPKVRAAVLKACGERADFDNVFASLLIAYTMHWGPTLGRFRYGVLGGYTSRGRGASYWCSGEARTTLPPGFGLRNRNGRSREWWLAVVNAGDRYSAFDSLLDKWGHYFSCHQPQFLATIGEGSVGDRELPIILRAGGYDAGDQEQFLADFEAAKLIRRAGQRWRLAIPVFHTEELKPVARACDRLSAGIAEALQASMPGFEKRVARCSFRKCAFSDVSSRMIGDAEGAVVQRMIDLGLVPGPPPQPAGDWGVFLILRSPTHPPGVPCFRYS